MPNDSRTVREALLAELLGDVDKLLTRVESLPLYLQSAEQRLQATAEVLETTSEQFRHAVKEFTQTAKQDLTRHLSQDTDQPAVAAMGGKITQILQGNEELRQALVALEKKLQGITGTTACPTRMYIGRREFAIAFAVLLGVQLISTLGAWWLGV